MNSKAQSSKKEHSDNRINAILSTAKRCRPGAFIVISIPAKYDLFVKINSRGDIVGLTDNDSYSQLQYKPKHNFKLSAFLIDTILDMNGARVALIKADVVQHYYLTNFHKREKNYPLFRFIIQNKREKIWDIENFDILELVTKLNLLKEEHSKLLYQYSKLRDVVFELYGTCNLLDILAERRNALMKGNGSEEPVKERSASIKELRKKLPLLLEEWDEHYRDNDCWQAMKMTERKRYILYRSYPVSIYIHLKFRKYMDEGVDLAHQRISGEKGEWSLSPENRYVHNPDDSSEPMKSFLDYFLLERENEIVYKFPYSTLKIIAKPALPGGLKWKSYRITTTNNSEVYSFDPFSNHMSKFAKRQYGL